MFYMEIPYNFLEIWRFMNNTRETQIDAPLWGVFHMNELKCGHPFSHNPSNQTTSKTPTCLLRPKPKKYLKLGMDMVSKQVLVITFSIKSISTLIYCSALLLSTLLSGWNLSANMQCDATKTTPQMNLDVDETALVQSMGILFLCSIFKTMAKAEYKIKVSSVPY